MKFLKVFFAVLLLSLPLYGQDTIRIASYNLLQFDGAQNSADRTKYFHHVLSNLNPDLLVCVEVDSQSAVDLFRREALDSSVYASARFINGFDHDAMLFFKKGMFEVPNVRFIRTDLRNIYVYTVKYLLNDSASVFYIAAVHLKASDGAQEKADRAAEVQSFLNDIAKNYLGAPMLMCGDFNLYTSTEPAYQALMADSQFYDPVNAPGKWSDGAAFTKWQSQSTRVDQFGGGSPGGLDDRFDFILPTKGFAHAHGWLYVKDSFHPYGQDGRRLNKAVWDPSLPNTAVSDTIAHSLMLASDHLPVTMLIRFVPGFDAVSQPTLLPEYPELLTAFPNPFNSAVTLTFTVHARLQERLAIYTSNGEEVEELVSGRFERGSYTFEWNASRYPSGVYFARLEGEGKAQSVKLVLTR